MSWSDRLVMFISKKMSAKYPRLRDYNMSVCRPCKKDVPWKKAACSACNSNICRSALPQDNQCCLTCSRRALGGNSLVVQWLGLHASNAGGTGSLPGQGAKSPHATRSTTKKKKKCFRSVSHFVTQNTEKIWTWDLRFLLIHQRYS